MKRTVCCLLAFVICVIPIVLCSCDTVAFEDSDFTVGARFNYGAEKTSDGRYMIMGFNEIYDLIDNKSIILRYEDSNIKLYYCNICFDETGDTVMVKVNAYRSVYYYKVEDGSFDYEEYQPLIYVFDLGGNRVDMIENGEALSKEAFDDIYDFNASFKQPNNATDKIEHFENYDISNSVYDYRYHDPDIELTELETKLLDAVFASEKIKISDGTDSMEKFYQFDINARRINGKIYFSYKYCNKKNFMSQYSVKSGYRSSVLLSYDENSGETTEILRLGKQSCIMAYSDTFVIYYDNNKLIGKNLITNESNVLLNKLPPSVYSVAFEDRFMITVADYENVNSQYGKTNERTYVYDLTGKLLNES